MAFKGPDHWFEMSQEEREKIGQLDSDVCFIERDIFVRGVHREFQPGDLRQTDVDDSNVETGSRDHPRAKHSIPGAHHLG